MGEVIKMGRPTVDHPRKLQVKAYVNDDEKEVLQRFAASNGVSESAALRLLLSRVEMGA